jgi:hypothetical protein
MHPRPRDQVYWHGFPSHTTMCGNTRRTDYSTQPTSKRSLWTTTSVSGNTLRILLFSTNPPTNVTNVVEMIDAALATALHAACSAIHRTLGVSPGGMLFHRDMFLDIPLLTDFRLIQEKWQVTIDDNLRHANLWRWHHNYQAGDKCLIIQHSPNKLEARKYGPFTIETVHINGTVTTPRDPHTTERMSIRHIVPYHPLHWKTNSL